MDDDTQGAYGAFREALAGYVRDADAAELRDALAANAGVITRLVPLVSERLGEVAAPVSLQPDEERTRLFDAVSQFLIGLARQRPLVMFLDDLHSAAPDTTALLRHVARLAAQHRFLLAGAYRSAEVADEGAFAETLAVLRRQPYFDSLRLTGLERDDVRTLLAALAGAAPQEPLKERVDAGLVSAILEHTRGNPFFVRSLTQHLVEEGALCVGENGWQAVVPIEEIGLPEGVRQVLGRRLKRLSEETRQFLTVAAAMGNPFRFAVTAAVAESQRGRRAGRRRRGAGCTAHRGGAVAGYVPLRARAGAANALRGAQPVAPGAPAPAHRGRYRARLRRSRGRACG